MALPEHECFSTISGETLTRLSARHLPELIAFCRREILARPQLQSVIERFHIADSDDWLKQAVMLFRMCPKDYSPAVEWHDEVGGLNFTAGLSISDANDCLCVLRDGMVDMIWKAAGKNEIPPHDVPVLVQAVLRAFDCALDAQAAAYMRESQRHLSEMNRHLRFRQQVFERDLALAKLVQQKFLPGNLDTENFRAEVRYIPTTGIGGDHAGLFLAADGLLYVTICDVTGHGIASALVAEVVNSQLRPLLRRHTDSAFEYGIEPVMIVRELNDLFCAEFQALGMLLTFFVALVDCRAGTLTYSGAGHPPPILQRRGKKECVELRSQNIILGAAEECIVGRGQDVVPIEEGDRVVFYTDGIMEANNGRGKMLGLKGLTALIEQNYETPSKRFADKIITTASRYYGGKGTDDMSLILLDVRNCGKSGTK